MRVIAIIGFLFIQYTGVFGQVSWSARVLDAQTKEPLIGTNIYLLTDFSVGATTDVNGQFQLTIPEINKADSILISFVGYEELILPANDPQESILLEEKELKMAEVEIRAEPLIAEEFKYVKVSKIEIYTNPAAKADPLLAVNSLPSSTTVDESAAVSLRGSSPIETGIFLNNVPVYDAIRYAQLNGIGTFSLFNTALVKDVTLFPGNPPLEFGNSTAGVVAITTDDQRIEHNETSLIISPANLGVQRKQTIGQINFQLFANYQPSAALKWANPKALEQLKGFQSVDGGLYFYGKIGKSINYKSYHYVLNESYEYRFIHPTFSGLLNQKRLKTLHVTELSLKLVNNVISWSSGFSTGKTNYHYSISDFDTENQNFYQGLSFFRPGEHFQLKTGLTLDARRSAVEGVFFTYPYAVGSEYPVFQLDESEVVTNLEAYAYGKYFLNESWILGGGLRKNLNELEDENYLSRQLNLTYQFNRKLKTIAGVGQYHKKGFFENSTEEVFIQSRQASLDFFYNTAGLDINLSLFTKDAEINNSANELMGFEIYIDKRFFKNWRADLAYTYLSPTEKNTYDLQYFAKANLQYTPGYWTFNINSIYRQGIWFDPLVGSQFEEELMVFMPFYGENESRYPDYYITNLAVSRIFPISEEYTMVAFASVNNITDHQNVRAYQYNYDYSERTRSLLSRRLFYAGVQINF